MNKFLGCFVSIVGLCQDVSHLVNDGIKRTLCFQGLTQVDL